MTEMKRILSALAAGMIFGTGIAPVPDLDGWRNPVCALASGNAPSPHRLTPSRGENHDQLCPHPASR
jgi:hypothetical protein